MKEVTNECCNCAVPGYPCQGADCINHHVTKRYCDECKEEFEPNQLYVYEGEELCEDCVLDRLEKVAY